MIPGSGDDRADAAFDLRFVNFMTGRDIQSRNPYWDIITPSISERDGRRVIDGGRPAGSARLGFAQTILQAVYAYAVPSPETIGWMTDFCADRTVVELGAGRGYWAAQLAATGLPADDAFFDALASEWKLESEDPQYVSWWNLADITQGWVRR
jgi:hypothetical protein